MLTLKIMKQITTIGYLTQKVAHLWENVVSTFVQCSNASAGISLHYVKNLTRNFGQTRTGVMLNS